MAKGYIYVITNEGKPGLCKVGFTERNPEDRAKELDGTHDPFPHEVAYAVKLDDAKKIEKKVHEDLKAYHVGASAERTGREWFRCSVERCKFVIDKYAVTPSIPRMTSNSTSKEQPRRIHWTPLRKQTPIPTKSDWKPKSPATIEKNVEQWSPVQPFPAVAKYDHTLRKKNEEAWLENQKKLVEKWKQGHSESIIDLCQDWIISKK